MPSYSSSEIFLSLFCQILLSRNADQAFCLFVLFFFLHIECSYCWWKVKFIIISCLSSWTPGYTCSTIHSKNFKRQLITVTLSYSLQTFIHFQSGGGETTTNASIPRPSEIFYNKLTPILKDLYKDKLDQVDLMNRKLWPTTTLLQVLSELLRETPKDLLARYNMSHVHLYWM